MPHALIDSEIMSEKKSQGPINRSMLFAKDLEKNIIGTIRKSIFVEETDQLVKELHMNMSSPRNFPRNKTPVINLDTRPRWSMG